MKFAKQRKIKVHLNMGVRLKNLSMEKISKIEAVILKGQLLFTNRTQTRQCFIREDEAEAFLQLGLDFELPN